MPINEHSVVLATADAVLRERLARGLEKSRWQVRQAEGGAAAMAFLEECQPQALLLDSWLPDLEAGALAEIVQQVYPEVDVIRLDGLTSTDSLKGSRKHELLHAVREAAPHRHWDGAIWNTTPRLNAGADPLRDTNGSSSQLHSAPSPVEVTVPRCVTLLPGLVGESPAIRELARLVRLVAPHSARVLIEGETGSGKELVARAVHTLSAREAKPFVALNCAAIPEALLEAELFGHTRGAFTGAVQARQGRIETANGGTLFLDEIGELPIALQAKLLRFLENGELQRIGGNETTYVDVRVVSATHQFLEERAEKGTFRMDLYHRLAAFPVLVPSLRERIEDLPMLVDYLLADLTDLRGSLQRGNVQRGDLPSKHVSASALSRLEEHLWPGNVRELQNVLTRAVILSEARAEIQADDVQFGRVRRN